MSANTRKVFKINPLVYLLAIGMVIAMFIAIGLIWFLIPIEVIYLGKITFENRTYYIYGLNKDKSIKYLCMNKIENRTCIITPLYLICGYDTCIRYIAIAKVK